MHRFCTGQLQIDGGKMDKFVAWSDNGGLAMSCFDATNMPEGKLAQEFILCDNFFHAAFGGSFLTPDVYVVNTAFTVNQPHTASADPATLVPNQTMPTIGDRLSEKKVSWAWTFGIAPLKQREANAGDLAGALQLQPGGGTGQGKAGMGGTAPRV